MSASSRTSIDQAQKLREWVEEMRAYVREHGAITEGTELFLTNSVYVCITHLNRAIDNYEEATKHGSNGTEAG